MTLFLAPPNSVIDETWGLHCLQRISTMTQLCFSVNLLIVIILLRSWSPWTLAKCFNTSEGPQAATESALSRWHTVFCRPSEVCMYVDSRGGPHTALAPRPSLIYCASQWEVSGILLYFWIPLKPVTMSVLRTLWNTWPNKLRSPCKGGCWSYSLHTNQDSYRMRIRSARSCHNGTFLRLPRECINNNNNNNNNNNVKLTVLLFILITNGFDFDGH
jgi:hypothetical protein